MPLRQLFESPGLSTPASLSCWGLFQYYARRSRRLSAKVLRFSFEVDENHSHRFIPRDSERCHAAVSIDFHSHAPTRVLLLDKTHRKISCLKTTRNISCPKQTNKFKRFGCRGPERCGPSEKARQTFVKNEIWNFIFFCWEHIKQWLFFFFPNGSKARIRPSSQQRVFNANSIKKTHVDRLWKKSCVGAGTRYINK